jgi:tetratricopeptide (TPR) repeat protein
MLRGVDTLPSFVVFLSMAIDKNTVTKEAQKFAAKGQFDKAIAEWKKLLKESPNDPNIYNTIGDLCLKKNAKAEAVDAYKRAADFLAADGFTSKAIALYKKVLNIDPKKLEVHLALGELNAEKGITGAALESYKLVADHYTQQNDLAKALGIYQKMADLNPSNVGFRVKLGDMYAKEGIKAGAAKAYLDASDAHIAKNEFNDARQLFEKVLSLDPNNKEVYHRAGIVYFKEGKFVEACKAMKPAFEADPKNQALADAYLDALSQAGRSDEAIEALKKRLSLEPDRMDLRDKLYQLYLSAKQYESALAEVSVLAADKMNRDEPDAAEELLRGFITAAPDSAAARRKLGDFYINVQRNEDAAKELLSAARLSRDSGDKESAREALTQAVRIAPHLSEARMMLENLDAAVLSAPAPLTEEPRIEEPRIEEPAPPVQAAPPALEEDPAISDAFTEADVLIKYGLAAKAVEQLEGLAVHYPENTRIRIRLRDLYRERGDIEKAVRQALLLSDIYLKQGRNDMSETALQTAFEIGPESPAILARLGKAPAEAAPELAPSIFEEAPTLEVPPQATAGDGNISFEGLDTQLPPLDQVAPSEAPPALELPEEEQQPARVPEERKAEVDLNEVWAEAEFYYQQGLFDEAIKHYAKIIELAPGDRRAIERLSEISREEDETRAFTKLTDAVEGLEDAVHPDAGEGALATSASDEEAVQSLMKEIAEMRKEQKTAPPPPRKARPVEPEEELVASAPQAKKPGGEDFFDLGAELEEEAAKVAPAGRGGNTSEDFFDLAAELRDELSNVAVAARPAAPVAEQSLDDIFEEFKKGVEQQATKEDIDTHYNLGVAYKEMGLLDDAIAEFAMTPEGEPRFVKSRYMLGLCYMEKSEYQNATAELRNALKYSESLELDAENRISMLYDLGLAYQGFGNIKAALGEFQNVSELDPGYRDTAAKLNELRQGDFISLEQLKEDIEKEISAKFFEEGERIEREEKSRKSDKIKSDNA